MLEYSIRDREVGRGLSMRERMEQPHASIGAGLWDDDRMNRSGYRSPQREAIFGYAKPVARWTRERFLGHVVPEDRDYVDGLLQQSLKQSSEWSFECKILRADGGLQWVGVHGQTYLDEEGRPARLAGMIQDITARTHAEQSLKQVSEVSAAIIATAKEGIIVLGTDMRYRLWRSFMEGMTGVRAAEVIGRHPLEVFSELRETGVMARLKKCQRIGAAEAAEVP